MGTNDRITQVFGYDANGNYKFVSTGDFSPELPWVKDGARYTLPEGIDMVAQHESPPQGLSFTASGGGGSELLGRRFRILTTVSYDSSYKTADGFYEDRWPTNITLINEGSGYTMVSDLWYGTMTSHGPLYDYTQSVATVSLTGLAALQYDLDAKGNHTLTFNAFMSKVGEDTVLKFDDGEFEYEREGEVYFSSERPWGGLLKTRVSDDSSAVDDYYYWDLLFYEERSLYSLQLLGDHFFDIPGETPLKVNWAASHNTTSTEEPDARSAEYVYLTSQGVYDSSTNRDLAGNNYRSWRFIDEAQDFARLDFEYESIFGRNFSAIFSSGASYDDSDRDVLQGRTTFRLASTQTTAQELFSADDARYYSSGGARDVTSEARRELKAGYLSGVFTFFDRIDVIAGARAESLEMSSFTEYPSDRKTKSVESLIGGETDLSLTNIFGFGPGEDGSFINGTLDRVFLLPSVGLAYRPTDNLKLRLNYTETVARPSFREYTAYLAFLPDSLSQTLGNPQLETSDVRSTDFRTEYLWGDEGNLAAISLFYKEVDHPIERVKVPSTSVGEYHTWVNNPNTAYLTGLELEFRQYLTFIPHWLGGDFWNDFSIGGNYTYIDAVVAVSDALIEKQTRPGGSWDPRPNLPRPDDIIFEGPRTERRLYNQPQWIVNADLTYDNADMGSRLTLAYYAISEILTSGGIASSSVTHDEYSDNFYSIDFTARQQLFEGCHLSFSVKNLTDSIRGVQYDPYLTTQDYYQRRYRVGRDYSISLSYSF